MCCIFGIKTKIVKKNKRTQTNDTWKIPQHLFKLLGLLLTTAAITTMKQNYSYRMKMHKEKKKRIKNKTTHYKWHQSATKMLST